MYPDETDTDGEDTHARDDAKSTMMQLPVYPDEPDTDAMVRIHTLEMTQNLQ